VRKASRRGGRLANGWCRRRQRSPPGRPAKRCRPAPRHRRPDPQGLQDRPGRLRSSRSSTGMRKAKGAKPSRASATASEAVQRFTDAALIPQPTKGRNSTPDLSSSSAAAAGALKARASHIWTPDPRGWYVEPCWTSARLFETEKFTGRVHDPAEGMGRVVPAAKAAGLDASGSDIVARVGGSGSVRDFLTDLTPRDNLASNPPFSLKGHREFMREFTTHALKVARHKVAFIFPIARLNAARWLADTPLRRVWVLSPRPPMPPGRVIEAGVKPGGGRVDFCWLVWEQGFNGAPEMHWLHRDGGAQR
jgi:hypothetical protein